MGVPICDTGPLVAAALSRPDHHSCVELFTGMHSAGRELVLPLIDGNAAEERHCRQDLCGCSAGDAQPTETIHCGLPGLPLGGLSAGAGSGFRGGGWWEVAAASATGAACGCSFEVAEAVPTPSTVAARAVPKATAAAATMRRATCVFMSKVSPLSCSEWASHSEHTHNTNRFSHHKCGDMGAERQLAGAPGL